MALLWYYRSSNGPQNGECVLDVGSNPDEHDLSQGLPMELRRRQRQVRTLSKRGTIRGSSSIGMELRWTHVSHGKTGVGTTAELPFILG